MNDVFAFRLFTFVSLFAVVEPLGIMPICTSMTSTLPPREQRSVARRFFSGLKPIVRDMLGKDV